VSSRPIHVSGRNVPFARSLAQAVATWAMSERSTCRPQPLQDPPLCTVQRIGGITTAAVAYAFRIVGLPLTCTSVAFCDRASTPHRVAETGRTSTPCCCEAQSMSTQPIQVARLLRHRTCGPCHRCHVPLRSNFTRAFGRAEVSGTALCDLCCTRRTPVCLICDCRLYKVAWVLQSALLCVP
jgi:hypothetical protein